MHGRCLAGGDRQQRKLRVGGLNRLLYTRQRLLDCAIARLNGHSCAGVKTGRLSGRTTLGHGLVIGSVDFLRLALTKLLQFGAK